MMSKGCPLHPQKRHSSVELVDGGLDFSVAADNRAYRSQLSETRLRRAALASARSNIFTE